MSFLFKVLTTLSFAALLIAPVAVKAGDDFGYQAAAPSALKKGITGSTDVPVIVGNLINVALSMIGIVFFLIIVYAGFNWMIARGNAEAVDKSKSMIEGAVIGLIIVVAAYAITTFIFDSLDKGATATGGNGASTSGMCCVAYEAGVRTCTSISKESCSAKVNSGANSSSWYDQACNVDLCPN